MSESLITKQSDTAFDYWSEEIKSIASWSYKSCIYHRCLWKHIKIPNNGSVVQLGVGPGLSLEILYQQFGDRVYGVDIYNIFDHPLVRLCDVRNLDDDNLAYVHCNVGNFTNTPKIRKLALEYSLRNLVSGGYCLTSGNHPYVEEFLGFKIVDLAKKYNCEVFDMPKDATIQLMNSQGKYHSDHECLIRKK